MLLTITTTSTNLDNLLSTAQRTQAAGSRRWEYQVILQNLGAQDIYYEFNAAASVTESTKIAQNETVSFVTQELSKINFISDTTSNNNIRVNIN